MRRQIEEKRAQAEVFAHKGGKLRGVAKRMRGLAEDAEENLVDVRKEDTTIRSFRIPAQQFDPLFDGKVVEVASVTIVKNHKPKEIDLQIEVRKDMHVLITGPNGIGKSTLLRSIVEGTAAHVKVTKDVRIGYYQQDFGNLDFEQTGYEALKAVMKTNDEHKLRSTAAGFLLDRALLESKIASLSEGQKGLLSFCRLVLLEPGLLILDEPTVGLDPKQVAEVRDLIKKLRGKHTIILSTHILPEVQMVCDRVIIINKGRIVAEDTLSDLNNKMTGGRKLHVRVKTPSAELLQKLNRVEGVQSILEKTSGVYEISTINSDSPQENVAALVATSGAGLIEIKSQELNLEDIFLKLVSEEARP
jgi:ABC-type multidrug transport system ATPase subunit